MLFQRFNFYRSERYSLWPDCYRSLRPVGFDLSVCVVVVFIDWNDSTRNVCRTDPTEDNWQNDKSKVKSEDDDEKKDFEENEENVRLGIREQDEGQEG